MINSRNTVVEQIDLGVGVKNEVHAEQHRDMGNWMRCEEGVWTVAEATF